MQRCKIRNLCLTVIVQNGNSKKIFKESKVILVREFILSCLLIASKSSHASKDLSIYKMRQWRIKRISPDQYVRGCLLINTNNQMIACMCEFLCANLRSNNVKDSFKNLNTSKVSSRSDANDDALCYIHYSSLPLPRPRHCHVVGSCLRRV